MVGQQPCPSMHKQPLDPCVDLSLGNTLRASWEGTIEGKAKQKKKNIVLVAAVGEGATGPLSRCTSLVPKPRNASTKEGVT